MEKEEEEVDGEEASWSVGEDGNRGEEGRETVVIMKTKKKKKC